MKTVIFPGSFDPISFGHLNLIERASKLSQRVIVAIAINSSKKTLFTLEERKSLVEQACAGIDGIQVIPFTGLLTDFAKEHNAQALIRGIRGTTDADYELQLSHVYHSLNSELETILLPAHPQTGFISSTVVKEVFKHHGDISHLAPSCVIQALTDKFK